METRLFDASQRRQVRRAADRAESLTAGFYCIPGREWPRFPYDISTLAHGPGPDEPVFADVVRMVPAGEQSADPVARRGARSATITGSGCATTRSSRPSTIAPTCGSSPCCSTS